MSAVGTAPIALRILGLSGPIRPANVMISNVPGPARPLYWNGARLTALYPLSIPVDGQALNITCTSTDDEIAFGLTACRRRLREWTEVGVWPQLHEMLLAEPRAAGLLEMDDVAVDGSHVRALEGDHTVPSPVDRARTGSKHHVIVGRHGTLPRYR